MLASLAFLAFYIKVKPFKDRLSNVIEIYNECTYYLCLNFCYLFTNIVPDTK